MEDNKVECQGNMEIIYNQKTVKISDLSNEEKIDCIARLWTYKDTIENEKEVLQEMIQKMYFYGKMENMPEEKE